MKVKATSTFEGNIGENDSSGYVKKGAVLDVTPNRAYELKRANLVEDAKPEAKQEAKQEAAAPTAPPAPPAGANKDNK